MSPASSEWQPWPAVNGLHLEVGRRLTRGPLVDELELRLDERFECQVVATSSGTAALEAILTAIGLPNVERPVVAVPSYGFHAAALAARRSGADVITVPVSAELEYTMEPDALHEETEVAVVVAIDQAGAPANYRALAPMCSTAHVPLVEDAAGAWGTWLDDRRLGTYGVAAALSMSESKVVAAGEGGCVVTRDASLADEVRAAIRYGERSHGALRRADIVGANWKMPELTAAVALHQLGYLEQRLAAARNAAYRLEMALEECEHLHAPRDIDGADVTWHKYRVRHDGDPLSMRALALQCKVDLLEDEFVPIPQQPAFADAWHAMESPVAQTFVVGSRAEPLWHVRPETLKRWCDGLRQLDERSHECR